MNEFNEEYFFEVAKKLLGNDADQLWSVSLMRAEDLDNRFNDELWGNCRYYKFHNCSEVFLADSFQGKNLTPEFIMETYIHELAHVRLNAKGKHHHKHGKDFQRVHRELKNAWKELQNN